MAKDATVQIRMDSELKRQVEELYKKLGTSFAEAVRIFARQSVTEGRMPLLPALKTWDELTPGEIAEELRQSDEDIKAGRVTALEELDREMWEKYGRRQDQKV